MTASPPGATAADPARLWSGVAVVVLAGGRARRFGGGDKTSALVGDRPIRDRILGGLPVWVPVVLVGPDPGRLDGAGPGGAEPGPDGAGPGGAGAGGDIPDGDGPEPPGRRARWTREVPPGGGPAAGLAAGCLAVPPETGVVLTLAGDLPFAAPAAIRLLEVLAGQARPAPEAAVGVDPAGRLQPLLGAYSRPALQRALGPRPAGRPLRDVLSGLRVITVPVTELEALDVDTRDDLARARRTAAGDIDLEGVTGRVQRGGGGRVGG